MAFAGLTDKPRVPALIRAALRATAASALVLTPMACGDDDGGDEASNSNGDDVAPTAGPCFHDPDSPGCGTGGMTMTMTGAGTMDMGEDTGDSGADTMDDPTADTLDDQAPTIPCAHDPNACESTGSVDDTGDGSSGDTGGDSGGSGGSGGSDSGGTFGNADG